MREEGGAEVTINSLFNWLEKEFVSLASVALFDSLSPGWTGKYGQISQLAGPPSLMFCVTLS